MGLRSGPVRGRRARRREGWCGRVVQLRVGFAAGPSVQGARVLRRGAASARAGAGAGAERRELAPLGAAALHGRRLRQSGARRRVGDVGGRGPHARRWRDSRTLALHTAQRRRRFASRHWPGKGGAAFSVFFWSAVLCAYWPLRWRSGRSWSGMRQRSLRASTPGAAWPSSASSSSLRPAPPPGDRCPALTACVLGPAAAGWTAGG